MAREKKSLGRPWADIAADGGPELLQFLQPEPEELAGLFFCQDRVQLRRAGHLMMAIGMALTGQVPPELFEVLADTPEEAYGQYQRYLAEQRMQYASRAFREAV